MNKDLNAYWIKNCQTIKGQDHLGLEAISINFYGKLLPGLTNLTIRIRYYGMYPWFLSHFVKLKELNNKRKWRDFVRRCEFLYALINSTEENEYAIPGSRLAKQLVMEKSGKILFDKYAAFGTRQSYWQHSFGAYGQYYLGVLKYLNIINTTGAEEIDFLGKNGIELVNILDMEIPSEITNMFFKCVLEAEAGINELKEMYSVLGASNILPYSGEADKLRKLFLEETLAPLDENRIDTIKLILNTMDVSNGTAQIDTLELRYAFLYKSLAGGKAINYPDNLGRIHSMWKAFMIGEHLHFALEAIFWCMLNKLKSNGPLKADRVLDIMVREIGGRLNKENLIDGEYKKSFHELIARYREKINADDANWNGDEMSMFNLYKKIATAISQEKARDAALLAVILLLKIYSQFRDSEELKSVYGTGGMLHEQFEDFNAFEILNEIHQSAGKEALDVFRLILRDFIINRHIRIALMKLRFEEKSTFKFMLHNDELVYIEEITPTFTGPRLRTALSFCEDLKLIDRGTNQLTPIGKTYLN